jgi:hypothetical protein
LLTPQQTRAKGVQLAVQGDQLIHKIIFHFAGRLGCHGVGDLSSIWMHLIVVPAKILNFDGASSLSG